MFDDILRKDPAGAYSRMDFDSRDLYRNQLMEIAEHSDFSEMEVAAEVLSLAQEAEQRQETNPRLARGVRTSATIFSEKELQPCIRGWASRPRCTSGYL